MDQKRWRILIAAILIVVITISLWTMYPEAVVAAKELTIKARDKMVKTFTLHVTAKGNQSTNRQTALKQLSVDSLACPSEANKVNPLLAGKNLDFISSDILSSQDPLLKNHKCVNYRNLPLPRHLTVCIYALAVDNEISRTITEKGSFEITKVTEMMKALKLFPHAMVVDLGSNVGVFTIPAAVTGHDVISVDALRSNHQLLYESVVKNNVTCRVTQLHNVVYNTRQPMEMSIQLKQIGRTSLSHINDNIIGKPPKKISHFVNSICMNDLAPLVRGRTVFLKMDLEGAEDEALSCADEFFNAADVKVFQIEWRWQSTHKIPSDFMKSFLTIRGLVPFEGVDTKTRLSLENSKNWPHEVYWIKKINKL